MLSGLVLTVQGSWLVGLLALLTFCLGAAGIRQRSIAASVLVLAMYSLGIVGGWILAMLGKARPGNPLLSIVLIMLLSSNLRAVILSKQWLEQGTDTEFPERTDGPFTDAVVNRYPALSWPSGRYVFFALAPVYILLSLLGLLAIAKATQQRATPDATTIQLEPSK